MANRHEVPGRLPTAWQTDPDYAARVHADVLTRLANGATGVDVARATGVSSRGVRRIRDRYAR